MLFKEKTSSIAGSSAYLIYIMKELTPAPWGLWATIAFGLLAFLAFIVIQGIALASYAYYQQLTQPQEELITLILGVANTGFGISLSFLPSAAVATLLIVYFAKRRKQNTVSNYLKLNPVSIKQILFWIAILLLFSAFMEILGQTFERPIPEWMISSYETARYIPLLWITLIIAAPIFEETLIRGFLLEGFRHTLLGDHGAILLTAGLWAIIHLQYEWFEIGMIFLVGILFGYARIHTNSLYTPIILHALMNLAATVQVALLLKDPVLPS